MDRIERPKLGWSQHAGGVEYTLVEPNEIEQSEHYRWLKKKFSQEIEALTRLNHPGIVGVLDAGEMPDYTPTH